MQSAWLLVGLTFWGVRVFFHAKAQSRAAKIPNCFLAPLQLGFAPLRETVFYGSGGAGLSVPRSRLKIDDGNHSGILSAFAARTPINSITPATVRGPVQSQSGRTMSVGW